MAEDYHGKSFDFAQDLTKQLITLATAIIGLEITFAKDLVTNITDGLLQILLGGSWVLFLFSIVAGIFTLMSLTGTLNNMIGKSAAEIFTSEKEEGSQIYNRVVRIGSFLQIGFFLFALLATIIFGMMANF